MGLEENAIVLFAVLMITYAGLIAASYTMASDPLSSDMNFLKGLQGVQIDFFGWMPSSLKNPTSMSSTGVTDYNFSSTSDIQNKTATQQITDAAITGISIIAIALSYISFLINLLIMLAIMPFGYYIILNVLHVPYIITFPVVAFISFLHVFVIARFVIDIKGVA